MDKFTEVLIGNNVYMLPDDQIKVLEGVADSLSHTVTPHDDHDTSESFPLAATAEASTSRSVDDRIEDMEEVMTEFVGDLLGNCAINYEDDRDHDLAVAEIVTTWFARLKSTIPVEEKVEHRPDGVFRLIGGQAYVVNLPGVGDAIFLPGSEELTRDEATVEMFFEGFRLDPSFMSGVHTENIQFIVDRFVEHIGIENIFDIFEESGRSIMSIRPMLAMYASQAANEWRVTVDRMVDDVADRLRIAGVVADSDDIIEDAAYVIVYGALWKTEQRHGPFGEDDD